MRRVLCLSLLSLAALAPSISVEAQNRREVRVVQVQQAPLVLRVRPRSYLDAGNVVAVGTTNRYATQDIASYINSPPYIGMRDRFGANLPDAIGGPFIGGVNPFAPIDFGGYR